MTEPKQPSEGRVVAPVDPTRRTEIDKQRVPMSARPYRLLALPFVLVIFLAVHFWRIRKDGGISGPL